MALTLWTRVFNRINQSILSLFFASFFSVGVKHVSLYSTEVSFVTGLHIPAHQTAMHSCEEL